MRSSMRTVMIVCALVIVFENLAGVSAAAKKVGICHSQKNEGWKLISVGKPAATHHLADHDDALPGGITPHTGTSLDAACEVMCPCAGVWTDSCEDGECIDRGNTMVVSCGFQDFTAFVEDTGGHCNVLLALIRTTVSEALACFSLLEQIAANNGIECQIQ